VAASVLASFILQIPNSGFGANFNVVDASSWIWGCVATMPLILLAGVINTLESSYSSLQETTAATQGFILKLLGGIRRPFLALGMALVVGLASGVGEELLFRGVLQYELSQRFGVPLALTASSVVFGVLHAATPLYFVLAALASAYYGGLYIVSNNLGICMISHGLYNAGVFLWVHWVVTAMTESEQRKLMKF